MNNTERNKMFEDAINRITRQSDSVTIVDIIEFRSKFTNVDLKLRTIARQFSENVRVASYELNATMHEVFSVFNRLQDDFIGTNLLIYSYGDLLLDALLSQTYIVDGVVNLKFKNETERLLQLYSATPFTKVIDSISYGLERIYEQTPLVQRREVRELWESHDYFMQEFMKKYGELPTYIALYKSDDFSRYFKLNIIEPVVEWWISKPISLMLPAFYKAWVSKNQDDILSNKQNKIALYEYFKNWAFATITPQVAGFIAPFYFLYKISLDPLIKIIGTYYRFRQIKKKTFIPAEEAAKKLTKPLEPFGDLDEKELSKTADKASSEIAKQVDKDTGTAIKISTPMIYRGLSTVYGLGNILVSGFQTLWLQLPNIVRRIKSELTPVSIFRKIKRTTNFLLKMLGKLFKWLLVPAKGLIKSFFSPTTLKYAGAYGLQLGVAAGIAIDVALIGKVASLVAEYFNILVYNKAIVRSNILKKEYRSVTVADIIAENPILRNTKFGQEILKSSDITKRSKSMFDQMLDNMEILGFGFHTSRMVKFFDRFSDEQKQKAHKKLEQTAKTKSIDKDDFLNVEVKVATNIVTTNTYIMNDAFRTHKTFLQWHNAALVGYINSRYKTTSTTTLLTAYANLYTAIEWLNYLYSDSDAAAILEQDTTKKKSLLGKIRDFIKERTQKPTSPPDTKQFEPTPHYRKLNVINGILDISSAAANKIRRKPFLIIHESAVNISQPPDTILTWHQQEGFTTIGYDILVDAHNAYETKRASMNVGAHAHGYNDKSIGVMFEGSSLVGRTGELIAPKSLVKLVLKTILYYNPKITIGYHFEVNNTTCMSVLHKQIDPILHQVANELGISLTFIKNNH